MLVLLVYLNQLRKLFVDYKLDLFDLSDSVVLDTFFSKVPNALLYHSIKYARVISAFLKVKYFCVVAVNDDGEVIGALPFFIKEHGGMSVANSMPFYGSHGGVVLLTQDEPLFLEILEFYLAYIKGVRCSVSTLISSPFTGDSALYERGLKVVPSDTRIGQVTELPFDSSYDAVMASLASKTRNMVRKSEKQDIEWSSLYVDWGLEFLAETHKENMMEIGGLAKPNDFFELLKSSFKYGSDYLVYIAYLKGRPISALLLFYSGETVEYFTPVIKSEYRSMQPLTCLIFNAMREAVERGYRYWNWGGTWATQEGVYRFKKSWGAIDMPYSYYTNIFDASVLGADSDVLLSEFPYFYTVPFKWLNK